VQDMERARAFYESVLEVKIERLNSPSQATRTEGLPLFTRGHSEDAAYRRPRTHHG
jgi:hypothetical protein